MANPETQSKIFYVLKEDARISQEHSVFIPMAASAMHLALKRGIDLHHGRDPIPYVKYL